MEFIHLLRSTCDVWFLSVFDVFVLRLDVRRSSVSPFSIAGILPRVLGDVFRMARTPWLCSLERIVGGEGTSTTTPSTILTHRPMGAFPRIVRVVVSLPFFLFRSCLDWSCVVVHLVQVIPCVRGEKQRCVCVCVCVSHPFSLHPPFVDRSFPSSSPPMQMHPF